MIRQGVVRHACSLSPLPLLAPRAVDSARDRFGTSACLHGEFGAADLYHATGLMRLMDTASGYRSRPTERTGALPATPRIHRAIAVLATTALTVLASTSVVGLLQRLKTGGYVVYGDGVMTEASRAVRDATKPGATIATLFAGHGPSD